MVPVWLVVFAIGQFALEGIVSAIELNMDFPKIFGSNSADNEIHRFFDSSPVSPNNKFIATIALPSFSVEAGFELPVASYKSAVIQVTDIHTGEKVDVDRTDAWDSQLGAQVQWGATDNELFYNILQDSTASTGGGFPTNANASNIVSGQTQRCLSIRGVRLDMNSMHRQIMQCPVYHVSSDGKLAAAPNLLNIHLTQKGYGVRLLDTGSHIVHVRGAAEDDGLYLSDTTTGDCKLLISLHTLARTAGLDTESTPTYGFHVKFSSDGTLIMFVVRTMERPVPPRKALVRVQHMFVVDVAGTHARRMISWASYPFVPARCPADEVHTAKAGGPTQCRPVHLRDGNHPNWVPNAHRISMNLQKRGNHHKTTDQSLDLLHKVSRLVGQPPQPREEWNIVSFDVDAHAGDFVYHYSTAIVEILVTAEFNRPECAHSEKPPNCTVTSGNYNNRSSTDVQRGLQVRIDHPVGSGHPIYHPSGNYIITDAYPKETQFVAGSGGRGGEGKVPLRLIEISTQREVQLLQMQVSRDPAPGSGGLVSRMQQRLQHHFYRAYNFTVGSISSALYGAGTGTGTDTVHRHLAQEKAAVSASAADNISDQPGTRDTSASTCVASGWGASRVASLPRPALVEDKSWRCDLHPAWSRDYQWVAINGRPGGGERQVLLVFVGPDPAAHFPG